MTATERRTIRIGDLGRVVTGKTPPTSQPELFGLEYPFLTPTDIDGVARYIEPERFLSPEGYDYQRRLMLPDRAVCVVCIGATIGKVCMTNRQSFTNRQLNSVVVNESEHDPFFVYYLMTTLRDELKANAGGAATPIINKTAFSEIKVSVSPLPVQKRIGAILSAYDESIENCQRRIRILEEIARVLYREWFVHFQFPGHEKVLVVDSPLGPIPKGWEVKRIGKAFKTVLGGTPSRSRSEFWKNGTIAWINSGKINDLRIIEPSELITESALEKSAAKLMPRGTTVIAITGATLGQVSYLEIEASANQSVVGILDESGRLSEWLYLFFKERINEIIQRASGGAQQHINKEIVNDVQVVIPASDVAFSFKQIVAPIFSQLAKLLFKAQNLRRTRDLLLPRLLSGN